MKLSDEIKWLLVGMLAVIIGGLVLFAVVAKWGMS